jgi:hypothetical protein
VGRWPLWARVTLLLVALSGLLFLVLRTGAFGAPQPGVLDLRGLPYLVVHLLVIGALLAAQALFLLDVIVNARLNDTARIIWGIALFVGNVIAMPVYWAMHLSRSRETA